ncbi:restriction endonuclease subunit R [Thermoleptolyngbya sp.]
MTIFQAKQLSIAEVHERFGFQRIYAPSFESFLALEPVTPGEQEELRQIRNDFDAYLMEGKVSEGMVKALTVFPLLRVAGYYRPPIKLRLEENIALIQTEDEEIQIVGRLDLLAVHKNNPKPLLWVLIVEAKNSDIDARAGLPQLLTYAYQSLERQDSVWGLTTNGLSYQFVQIQNGEAPSYQLLPILNLMEFEPPTEIVQVLKAIRQ